MTVEYTFAWVRRDKGDLWRFVTELAVHTRSMIEEGIKITKRGEIDKSKEPIEVQNVERSQEERIYNGERAKVYMRQGKLLTEEVKEWFGGERKQGRGPLYGDNGVWYGPIPNPRNYEISKWDGKSTPLYLAERFWITEPERVREAKEREERRRNDAIRYNSEVEEKGIEVKEQSRELARQLKISRQRNK